MVCASRPKPSEYTKLTWIGTFTCGCGAVNGLAGATGLDVTPDGQYVIADGNSTAAVTVLDRDPLFQEAMIDSGRAREVIAALAASR